MLLTHWLAGPTSSPKKARAAARRLTAELLEARDVPAAVVLTDRADYSPGSTAAFTATSDGGPGLDFAAGETVQFQVSRTDGVPGTGPSAEPWQVADGVGGFDPYQDGSGVWHYPDTDGAADGSFGTTWYVDGQYAGAALRVTATGLGSGAAAAADFTDSPKIASASLGLQSPNPLTAGSLAYYSFSVTRTPGELFTANLSVSSTNSTFNSYVFPSFWLSTLTFDSGGGDTRSTTLQLNTSRGMPRGSYPFTTRASVSGTPADYADAAGTLVMANNPPQSGNATYNFDEDNSRSLTLYGLDYDGDTLTYTIVSYPANGTLSGTGAARTYTPNANYFGTDTFTYQITDGNGGTSATATITLNVASVNDQPTIDPVGSTTILEDAAAQTVSLTGIGVGAGYESDQSLTVTATSDNPGLVPHPTVSYTSPAATGSLQFAPVPNVSGTATVTVTVTDSGASQPVPAGNQFRVNAYQTNDQITNQRGGPGVAYDAAGNSVVVWTSYQQDGAGHGVYAQRYAADGSPVGAEFRVNTYTSYDQLYQSVGMAPDGRFVIAWSSGFQDGSSGGVYVQRYNADGTPAGSEFRVNVTTASDQGYPSVGMAADGRFLITWASLLRDLDGWGIAARWYAPDGTPAGGDFLVNNYTSNNQEFPTVGMAPDGRFTVMWYGDGPDNVQSDVYARRYTNQISNIRTRQFTVTVLPVNDVPYFIKGSDLTVLDNAGPQSVANWATGLSAGPPDESGQALTFFVVTDNPGLFTAGGQPAVSPAGTLTFTPRLGAGGMAGMTIWVQDNGGTANGGLDTSPALTFIITVIQTNRAPTDLALAPASIAEDQPSGTTVGTFSSTDPDAGNTFTYSLVAGAGSADNAAFAVAGDTLKTSTALDYEAKPSYSVRVRTTDQGGLYYEKVLTVGVTNVAPGTPADADGAADTVAEGATAGTPVGVTAAAADPGGSAVTYTLTDDAGGRFAVNATTGVVTVANGSLLEGPGSHSITVRAGDGAGGFSSQSFTVAVTNVAPTGTLDAPASIVYGYEVGVVLRDPADPSAVDRAAGLHYAFALNTTNTSPLGGATYAGTDGSQTASFDSLTVGTYYLFARVIDEDGDYTEYSQPVAVTARPLTITAADRSKTYGDALTLGTAGFTTGAGQLVAGDAVTAVTLTSAGAAATAGAGSYPVVASAAVGTGLSNYAITYVDGTLTVARKGLTVTADDQSKTYDGAAFTAFTATYAGFVGGEGPGDLGGALAFGGTAAGAVNAGTYTITPSGLTSANYAITFGSGVLTIGKAGATVVVTGYAGVYDGVAHGATGMATGAAGENLSALLDLGASFTNVPGGTADWSFAGDANHNPASGSVTVAIAKADATIAVTGYSVTYDGLTHTAAGTATGVGGADLGGLLDLSGTAHTDAGSYADGWTFAGNGNYNAAAGTVASSIAKADQTITWADPAGIVYGTALSAAQLDATVAGVPGGSAPGARTYDRAAGDVLNAGDDQPLTVTAAATANYNAAPRTVYLDVARAALTVTADGQAETYDGAAFADFTASSAGFVNGDDEGDLTGLLDFSGVAVGAVAAGSYPIVPGRLSSANYDIAFVPGTLTIGQKALAGGFTAANKVYDGTTAATATSGPGSYPITAAAGTLAAANYSFAFVRGNLAVTAEDARVGFTGPNYATTTSATATTVRVTLTAAVTEPADGSAGDLTKAKVTFTNRDTGAVIASNVPVSLSGGVYRATYNWSAPIGTADGATFHVGVAVTGGWYARSVAADDALVTVKRTGTGTAGSVGGGGALTASASDGTYAAAAGSAIDFGLAVKPGASPTGTVRIITRAADGHVYLIQSTSIATLTTGTSAGGATATITGRVSVTDITDPANPVVLVAGAGFTVQLTDGATDSLAVTVTADDGILLFASNTAGEQGLATGSVQVV